jgi:hypothetical protein
MLLLIAVCSVAGGLLWHYSHQWKDFLFHYIENGEILTLESRYTPEQIMASQKATLLGTGTKRSYQDPTYKYYPYLLLDVKYTEDQKSREGALLWSFTNGELVLNTDTWDMTHGFKDCLDCSANRFDFKILQALVKKNGSLSMDELQKELHVERDILETWVEEAKTKHLVTQKGNLVQMHFENPKILTTPQTKIKQHFVSKPITNPQREPKVYSRGQIIDLARASFGSDLKIRSEREVFLPVYSIGVLNVDGSVHVSHWNAVTGQRILPGYLSQN